MKTSKPVTIISMRLLAIITMMTLVSCSNQAQDKTENTSKVKAPKVDLHTAVITANQEAVQQHIKAGSNLDEKDPFGGSSPLITAALFGRTEIAKDLIDAGAKINFTNNEGSTALHTAAFFCETETVKLLLENGADKTIKNKYGATALESVSAPYSEVKSIYEMMQKSLAPMGLKLDFQEIEETRPVVAEMLK